MGRQVELLLPRGALALLDLLVAGVVLRVGAGLVRLGGLEVERVVGWVVTRGEVLRV
ncbi:MAG: hypothetical protein ABGY32_01415 [bacterium]